MSSNRLRYDQCSYKSDLSQSVGPLGYVLNPMKYENCGKCRHEFGLLGGQAVSNIKGNMIGDDGIILLSESLKDAMRLTYLDTYENSLTMRLYVCSQKT